MPATTRPSLSSIFFKIRNYCFFAIIPKVFISPNITICCFLVAISRLKIRQSSMRNGHVHEPVIGQIHHFFPSDIDLNPFIVANQSHTVYPKKYAHGFCFAVLCCGYTLADFPICIRLTSLALWQSNDCPSASKATLVNMDKYFMWIHYKRLHNHNKAKHNKTVCIFLGIYCRSLRTPSRRNGVHQPWYNRYCWRWLVKISD